MSPLDIYIQAMGESVTWKHRTSIDQYGDPTYSESSIDVLWFDEQKVVYDATQTTVLCDAYFLTDESIEVGDAITRNGITWPVVVISKDPTIGDYAPYLVGMARG